MWDKIVNNKIIKFREIMKGLDFEIFINIFRYCW